MHWASPVVILSPSCIFHPATWKHFPQGHCHCFLYLGLMCGKTISLNCIHLSVFVCGFFRLQGLMKTERHQFNYNVLDCYWGEIVFIWRLNEFLISLLLTWFYLRLKWGSSQLHSFVLPDGQVFVPLLRQITFARGEKDGNGSPVLPDNFQFQVKGKGGYTIICTL